jgi:esterase
VADIAPVAYGHTQQPMIDAMRAVDLARWSGAAMPMRNWRRWCRKTGCARSFCNRLTWPGTLAAEPRRALGEYGAILGWPGTDRGASEAETLFLSGGASDYVSADHRPAIKALFPNAKFAKIPGAGHWLHAEKPREFEAALRAYLTQGGSSG